MDRLKLRFGIVCTLLAFVQGCNLSPKPLTKDEIITYLSQDRFKTYENVEPVTKPLTLYDAMARAIKYNLQYKVKVSEAAIGLIDKEAVTYEMLPNLIANTSFISRSNEGALASPITGQTSTARNRDTWLYDLNLSWNILDFGISYYNSKQKSNAYLILEEKKRTMLQDIIRDTRTAYWASQVSSVIMPQVEKLSKELNESISKSMQQEKEKVIEKDKAAKYRIELWDTTSEINRMAHNLERSRHTFSALINIPTYEQFKLDQNFTYNIQKHNLPYDIKELELIGLYNRPELREEILQNKIAVDEIYKARLKLIPNLTLIYGGNYDSTTYLVDQFWREASVKLTWNIFRLFSRYYELEKAKSAVELANLRRQALGVSIITQINVAYARIKEAERHHQISRSLFEDNLVIYENERQRQSSNLASNLDLLRAKISYIEAKFKLLTSHYDRIIAYNELLDALGYNSITRVTTLDQPLDTLAQEISQSFNSDQGFYITPQEIKNRVAINQGSIKSDLPKIKNTTPDDKLDPRLLQEARKAQKSKNSRTSDKAAKKINNQAQAQAQASAPARGDIKTEKSKEVLKKDIKSAEFDRASKVAYRIQPVQEIKSKVTISAINNATSIINKTKTLTAQNAIDIDAEVAKFLSQVEPMRLQPAAQVTLTKNKLIKEKIAKEHPQQIHNKINGHLLLTESYNHTIDIKELLTINPDKWNAYSSRS